MKEARLPGRCHEKEGRSRQRERRTEALRQEYAYRREGQCGWAEGGTRTVEAGSHAPVGGPRMLTLI